jgi:hypothetical protein
MAYISLDIKQKVADLDIIKNGRQIICSMQHVSLLKPCKFWPEAFPDVMNINGFILDDNVEWFILYILLCQSCSLPETYTHL